MRRSIAGHNPYNLFIFTIDDSKNFTTTYVQTVEHMAMCVIKSIVIQTNGQVYWPINSAGDFLNAC